MDILLNKTFKGKNQKIEFAERVSGLIVIGESNINSFRTVELINMYNRKIRKAKTFMETNHDESMPFLFLINQN